MNTERKGYRTREARTAYKRGPSGRLYLFQIDRLIYPETLDDEEWMKELCGENNYRLLLEVDPANPFVEKEKKLKRTLISDVTGVPAPPLVDVQFSKTGEEKEEELELAKEAEEAEADRKLFTQKAEDSEKFLSLETLEEPIHKIIRIVEIFLEESKLPKDTKVEMIKEFVSKDPKKRETLAGRVEDTLRDFGKE